MRDKLRGCMELKLREKLPRDARSPEVLHYYRVWRGGVYRGKRLHGAVHGARIDQRVKGDIDLPAGRSRVGREVGKLALREVLRKRPRGKAGEPAIYGVRSGREGRKRSLEVPCGRKKLYAHLSFPEYAALENGGVSVFPSRQSRTAFSRAFMIPSLPSPAGV